MFVSRYQYLVPVLFGTVITIQVIDLGFNMSPLINFYIFVSAFLACSIVGIGVWFVLTSVIVVVRLSNLDYENSSLFPIDLPIVETLSSITSAWTLAIAWMEIVFLLPLFFGPFADSVQAQIRFRTIWIGIILAIVSLYFALPQIALSQLIAKERIKMLRKFQSIMKKIALKGKVDSDIILDHISISF